MLVADTDSSWVVQVRNDSTTCIPYAPILHVVPGWKHSYRGYRTRCHSKGRYCNSRVAPAFHIRIRGKDSVRLARPFSFTLRFKILLIGCMRMASSCQSQRISALYWKRRAWNRFVVCSYDTSTVNNAECLRIRVVSDSVALSPTAFTHLRRQKLIHKRDGHRFVGVRAQCIEIISMRLKMPRKLACRKTKCFQ